MYDAAALAWEVEECKRDVAFLQEQQIQAEADFAEAMGDFLRDGYWSDTNYILGQEQALYDDAVNIMKTMARPTMKYTVSRVNLEHLVNHNIWDYNLNTQVRVYDPLIKANEMLYVTKITHYLDGPWEDKLEITNENISMPGRDMNSILQRMSLVASELQARQDVFGRVNSINRDGSVYMERLEGQINILKNQLMASVSSWYTDDNGNIMFEAANGQSAMKLCGDGFMIADGRDDNGEWNWRTKPVALVLGVVMRNNNKLVELLENPKAY